MSELYLRCFRSIWALLFVLSCFVEIVLFSRNPLTMPLEYWVIHSYYIRVYLNTVFIIFSIYRTKRLRSAFTLCAVRTGLKEYEKYFEKCSGMNVLLYFVLAILPLLLLNLNRVESVLPLIVYLVFSIWLLLLFEEIYKRIASERLPEKTVYLPLLINLAVSAVQSPFFYSLFGR